MFSDLIESCLTSYMKYKEKNILRFEALQLQYSTLLLIGRTLIWSTFLIIQLPLTEWMMSSPIILSSKSLWRYAFALLRYAKS